MGKQIGKYFTKIQKAESINPVGCYALDWLLCYFEHTLSQWKKREQSVLWTNGEKRNKMGLVSTKGKENRVNLEINRWQSKGYLVMISIIGC
jgi:hypothetical protein